MSYDIYFIKTKDVNPDNIERLLEGVVNESDEHFISKEEMLALKDSIASLGYEYELFENDDEYYIEMSFKSCQVSIFNSQAAITVPYWAENVNDTLAKEVESITQIFLKNGFTGYDQQTEEIFTSDYKFLDSFKSNLSVVNESLNELKKQKKSSWIIFAVGIILIILVFVVWKLIM